MNTNTDVSNASLLGIYAAQIEMVAAETQLHRAVEDARRNGATWAEVGGVLDCTRQAAQQRFS